MAEILDDFELNKEERVFPIASGGKRFGNYIIDIIFFYILAFVFGIVLALFYDASGGDLDAYVNAEPDPIQELLESLYGILALVVFYFLQEFFLKGKTIGKYLTKTRAVTEDYKRISAGQALGRSFCRLIPFEAFSFFGDKAVGWHDSIPNTYVIEDEGWTDDTL